MHLTIQADIAGSITCTVRATEPPAESSYNGYGKLIVRLDGQDHTVEVKTVAALTLYRALRGRSSAPAELQRIDNVTAELRIQSRRRPRLT